MISNTHQQKPLTKTQQDQMDKLLKSTSEWDVIPQSNSKSKNQTHYKQRISKNTNIGPQSAVISTPKSNRNYTSQFNPIANQANHLCVSNQSSASRRQHAFSSQDRPKFERVTPSILQNGQSDSDPDKLDIDPLNEGFDDEEDISFSKKKNFNLKVEEQPVKSGASFKKQYQKLAQDILSGKRTDTIAKLLEEGSQVKQSAMKKQIKVKEINSRFEGYVKKTMIRKKNLQKEIIYFEEKKNQEIRKQHKFQMSHNSSPVKHSSKKQSFNEFLTKQNEFSKRKESKIEKLRVEEQAKKQREEEIIKQQKQQLKNKMSIKINKRRGSDQYDSNSSIFDRLYQNDKPIRQYFHSPGLSSSKKIMTPGEDSSTSNNVIVDGNSNGSQTAFQIKVKGLLQKVPKQNKMRSSDIGEKLYQRGLMLSKK